jgi:hypothetical protein
MEVSLQFIQFAFGIAIDVKRRFIGCGSTRRGMVQRDSPETAENTFCEFFGLRSAAFYSNDGTISQRSTSRCGGEVLSSSYIKRGVATVKIERKVGDPIATCPC